jgi:proteic killer suppression protein
MLVEYPDERTKALFDSGKALVRAFGPVNARLIRQRLDDLQAVATLDEARGLPGKLEELKGDRRGQFSMRLHGGMRLLFRPSERPPPGKPDGGLDLRKIRTITILNAEDYHD